MVDSVTGAAVTTATVTAVSGSGRSPVTAVNTGGGNYKATIDPTTYSFNVSAPGYASLYSVGPIPYVPGESPPTVPVQLVLDENSITGKALTPGSSTRAARGDASTSSPPEAGPWSVRARRMPPALTPSATSLTGATR